MRNAMRYQRFALKAAVAELACQLKPRFHVIAQLPPTTPFRVLERALREWDARVNRHYLGKSHFKPENANRRMSGLVFFEMGKSRQHNHAHMLLVPPLGAFDLHFRFHAKYWFQPHFDPSKRTLWKCVAPRGTMEVFPIGQTPQDIGRLAGYVTKELEFEERAIKSWRFLQDLCRFS